LEPEYLSLTLTISIYLTAARSKMGENFAVPNLPWGQVTPSNVSVTICPERPVFQQVLEREIEQQIGAMAVAACGPGGMGDDVREAVQEGRKTIDFFEETFSW
jgi:hypothetical protein